MDPLRIYDYLTMSRQRVLDGVRPLTPAQYGRSFDFGLGSIGVTLTHTMISEWYYIERLDGRTVPPYEQWPIQDESPPPFDEIDATWRAQAPRVRASIAEQRDWRRPISWFGFPDATGRRRTISTNAGDLVTQLVLHEVHHRAQLMSMLRTMGDGVEPVQDIDFNEMMFERRDEPPSLP